MHVPWRLIGTRELGGGITGVRGVLKMEDIYIGYYYCCCWSWVPVLRAKARRILRGRARTRPPSSTLITLQRSTN